MSDTKVKLPDLQACCAPGASHHRDFVEVEPGVKLPVEVFTPAKDVGNPALFIAPGWLGGPEIYNDVFQNLTKDIKVYYIHTRVKPTASVEKHAQFSIEILGQDLIRIVDHYRSSEAKRVVLSVSLSATAFMDQYDNFENKPEGSIIMIPNVAFAVPWFGVMWAKFFPTFLLKLMVPLAKLYVKHSMMDHKEDPSFYERTMEAMNTLEFWKIRRCLLAYKDYKLPEVGYLNNDSVMFITASKDPMHEPEDTESLIAKLPKSRQFEIGITDNNEGMIDGIREMMARLNAEVPA